MLNELDDRIIAVHQRVFDEVEYRYGLTTAQCTEVMLTGLFVVLMIESYFAEEAVFMGILLFAILTVSFILKAVDRHIRSNRRAHVEAILNTRKGGIVLFLRFYLVINFAVAAAALLASLTYADLINLFTSMLNLIGIYFSACLDDVDGDKRRRMEREAAEAELDAVEEGY